MERVLNKLGGYLSDPINIILNNCGFGENLEDEQEQENDLYNLMEERLEEKDKYVLSVAFIHKLNSYSNCSLEEFLMLELNKYEKYFSDYIKTEVTNKYEEYHKTRNNILTKLSGGLGATHSISVMNFNFTPNQYSDSVKLNEKIGLANVNVHGSYLANSIFGIDTKSLEDIDTIGSGYRFTKTYRKLTLKTKRSTEILYHDITDIIFYGHSLGPADYAYFQSIFDYLDIYNNTIVLTFYYSDYKENVREEQTIAVRNLIEEYGKTFDNKDKGKNLLHKLLLEERISITDLEIYEEDYSSKDMK
ncbi:AbiH family protein [Listeria innocua]